MKTKIFFTSLLMAVFFLTSLCYSGVKSVGWQGRVIDSSTGHPIQGTWIIIFSIYPSASGGSPLWTETHSTFIDSGIAQVLMGSVTPIPDSVFNGSVRFLGVKVGSDPEMTPRSEMVSVPYASYAFAGGGWKDNGTAVTLATSTDNVGIGTTNPTAKLHVVGDAYISDKLTVGSPVHLGNIGNPGNFDAVSICYPGAGDETSPEAKLEIVAESPRDFLMLSSTPAANGDKLIVKNDGKVGIGTTNPSWDLALGYATTREIGVERAVMGDGATLKIHAGNAFDDAITEHDGGDLYLYGGGGVYNGIDGDVILAHTGANPRGNVGIGTTEPGAKLEVKDNPNAVYASGPPVGYFGTETTNKIALVGDASAGSSILLPAGKNIGIYGQASGGAENWSGYFVGDVYASGKVYIGSQTPGFSLSFPNIVGDKISLYGQSGNHYGFGIQNGLLQIHSEQVSSDIAFGYGSSASFTENMRIKGNGSVGIGTTNPQEKLHVWWATNVDAELGRGTADMDITYLALRNANGTKYYIYPNSAGTGIVMSVNKP